MKGWLIIKHSLRQVFGNLNGALRVSAVLYIVQTVITLALGVGATSMMGGQGPGAGLGLSMLLAFVVVFLISLWIAVAWHRYVLLGEEASFVPTFRGDRIWAYFLRSLVYGLILVVFGVVWGLIVGVVLGSTMANSQVAGIILMGVLVYLPILVIGSRLTSDLPGVALGAQNPILTGWKATQGHTGDLVVMTLIIVVLSVAVQLVGAFVFAGIPGINLVWELVIGWLQTMIAASILTTLYGHYIEKRDLV